MNTWTAEMPTREGWYWRRMDGENGGEPEVVEVYYQYYGGLTASISDDSSMRSHTTGMSLAGKQWVLDFWAKRRTAWAGPIELPAGTTR
jgi:hypothetical protein